MERLCTSFCRSDAGYRQYWSALAATLLLWFCLPHSALAGLSGTYTIGGAGGSYTSIDNAISALESNGVDGAVVFEISGGSYTAPSGGYLLRNISGMSATNTVTFKPAANATVTISASLSSASIFRIYGGHHFIIDGSNGSNGTSRNMTIVNTSTSYGTAIMMEYNADNNIVRNCVLQSNSAYYSYTSGGATVLIGRSASTTNGGNDSNIVQNNKIGHDDGTYRAGVAVHLRSSSSSYPNRGNQILNNDIVNFGKMYGSSYYQGYSYGIYVDYYNHGTVIRGNHIHLTEEIGYYYVYGVYVYEYYGYSRNTIIDANRLYDFGTTYTYSYLYHIYLYNYRVDNSTSFVTNNMISMMEPTAYCYGIYLYPYYASSNSVINIYNNSVYAGGTNANRTTYMLYAYGNGGAATVNHKNNIYFAERTPTTTSYGLYISYISNWNSDYNLIDVQANSLWRTAYYYNSGGGTYTTLAQYQGASGDDAHTVQGNPQFLDADDGDLHIDIVKPAVLESRGTVVSTVPTDFDGDARSTFAPDIGADEGNFNGGGIQVVYPNGGEDITSDYTLTVRYSTNRPLGVVLEMSLNGGASWINVGTVNPTNVGANEFSFTTPDTVTDKALVRIISTSNSYESDTSNREFSLVRPIVTLIQPNGGQFWIPTDTNRIQWTSQYLPPVVNIQFDYSTDGGGTWLPIAGGVSSQNLPAVNTFNWIIPNTPTQQARVRAKIDGGIINDVSDQTFTILPMPALELTAPTGGETWFSGEKATIAWNSVTTDYLSIDYSTDQGNTWMEIIDRVPAYVGSYDWMVPERVNAQILIRITNNERPRFVDVTSEEISIRTSELTVLSPNGGEGYELNEPVTVRWMAVNTTTLRLDYSADNGQNWTMIRDDIAASSGAYSFVPPQIPTKLARVRLVDIDRQNVSDLSDRPFEIRGSKSITVLAPGQGDQLLRNSTTNIMWDAPQITNVNIHFSTTGAGGWTVIASNIQAATGNYVWNVPNALTSSGRIRIQEVGGQVIGESGTFAIVDKPVSSLRLIAPNGGETYTEGDPVMIRWTSSGDLLNVALSWSDDGGANWKLIARNVSATLGMYNWTAPAMPSTTYSVKVEAAEINDVSDSSFTVARRLMPQLTLLAPNGGENLTEGDTVKIQWTATDVTGTVDISYSFDGKSGWMPIATVSVSPMDYEWILPADAVGTEIWVQIAATDGSASDMSDDPFSVDEKTLEPIRIVTPNGGEMWVENETRQITWESPDDITQVELHYSTDGGQSWKFIAGSASVTGLNSYDWTIPQASTMQALVRVRSTSDTARVDVSDGVFTIEYSPLGVPGSAVTGTGGLQLLGNYPNPFAASTELRWLQPTGSDVLLKITDGSGRMVREVSLGRLGAGEHRYLLGADGLASGVYFYELNTGRASVHGVMMLAR
jgi:hypothetical protein